MCMSKIPSGQGPRQIAANMNLFKSLTLKWWQTGIFKTGMLALGTVLGAYLHAFFGAYLVPIIIISALSLAYITYLWLTQ